MSESDRILRKTMKALLNEKLSEREITSFKDEGFMIKNPTRRAAVMIALYKKAAAGDLAAIKELRSIVSENCEQENTGRAVMIIDDIRG